MSRGVISKKNQFWKTEKLILMFEKTRVNQYFNVWEQFINLISTLYTNCVASSCTISEICLWYGGKYLA